MVTDLCSCHVDSVREWRDHESWTVPEVLIVVRQDGVGNGDFRSLSTGPTQLRVSILKAS